MDVNGVCTDWVNELVTTPAYMQGNAKPHEVYDGVQHFVRKVNTVVQQQKVVTEEKKKEEQTKVPRTEDVLTANFIQSAVNRIWDDYDTSKDGRLDYEESKAFINDSFGNDLPMKEIDLKAMFDKIDTDKSGKINKGEMSVFLLQLTKY